MQMRLASIRRGIFVPPVTAGDMHLATFRISGTDIYERTTAEAPVDVELWCNDHCDLLHIEGDDAVEALAPVREAVGLREFVVVDGGEEVVAITAACLREHEAGLVEDYVEANDCLLLPPLRYRGGDEIVRVLALDPGSLTRCYRDMVTDGLSVTVDSKRAVETVSERTPVMTVHDALPELTARQRTVIRTAIDAGYYEIPRQVTTEELAERVGLARRTTEEHLRRAEKKLVTGMAEFL